MSVLPACMSVHQHLPGTHGDRKKASNFHGTEDTEGCEQPCGCWELNLCLLEKQPGLLAAEPSLKSVHPFTFKTDLHAGRNGVCLERHRRSEGQSHPWLHNSSLPWDTPRPCLK